MAIRDWATAANRLPQAADDHNRMTRLHSQSSQVSRWRDWIGAWGQRACNERPGRMSRRVRRALAHSRVGWTSQPTMADATRYPRSQRRTNLRLGNFTRWATRKPRLKTDTYRLLNSSSRQANHRRSSKALAMSVVLAKVASDTRPVRFVMNTINPAWSRAASTSNNISAARLSMV